MLIHAVAVVISLQRALQGRIIGHEGFGGFVDKLADALKLTTSAFSLAL